MAKIYRPEIGPQTFESIEAHAENLGISTPALINLILLNWLQNPALQVKSDLAEKTAPQVPATTAPQKSEDVTADSITIEAWSPPPNAGPVFETTPEKPSSKRVIGDDD